jgi:hypothetical protein
MGLAELARGERQPALGRELIHALAATGAGAPETSVSDCFMLGSAALAIKRVVAERQPGAGDRGAGGGKHGTERHGGQPEPAAAHAARPILGALIRKDMPRFMDWPPLRGGHPARRRASCGA